MKLSESLILLGLWLGVNTVLFAQNTYRSGLLPQVNAQFKAGKNWRFNLKGETRLILSEGVWQQDTHHQYRYERTDLGIMVGRKTGLRSAWAVGFLYRWQDGTPAKRLSQQFTTVSKLEWVRVAHRLLADQTFREGSEDSYRLRYRLGIEIPTNGEDIDKHEVYIKAIVESIYIRQGTENQVEIRLIPGLGYYITDRYKMETGIDYRTTGTFDGTNQLQLWWFMALYVAF